MPVRKPKHHHNRRPPQSEDPESLDEAAAEAEEPTSLDDSLAEEIAVVPSEDKGRSELHSLSARLGVPRDGNDKDLARASAVDLVQNLGRKFRAGLASKNDAAQQIVATAGRFDVDRRDLIVAFNAASGRVVFAEE